jgi:transposase
VVVPFEPLSSNAEEDRPDADEGPMLEVYVAEHVVVRIPMNADRLVINEALKAVPRGGHLMFPSRTRVFFAVQPTDLRRSFDGLAVTAHAVLERDPAQGGLFVFLNKRGDQVRVLFRDRHGWCVLAKRLDRGRFDRTRLGVGTCREAEASELMRFLEEIIPARVRTSAAAPTKRGLSVVEHSLSPQ